MTDADDDPSAVRALRSEYRGLAIQWAAEPDSTQANKVFRLHHRLYKTVRDTPEGQEAISGLLGDSADAVRLLAATHSLAWDRDRAEAVLEQLATGDSLLAVDAHYTLKAHREGSLGLDW
jgi:hypothetical protein